MKILRNHVMYFADKLILKRKIQSRFNSDMVFIKGFVVPFKNFSLIWRCHHYRWKTANFNLIVFSALIAIEQWGFFSVPRLLWHGTSVYNGHLWGPLTLTPVAERLTSCFNDQGLSQSGFKHPTFRMQGERSNRLPLLL